jgi:hypothetical protein
MTRMSRKRWRVEGWRGLEAVGFGERSTARGTLRLADHYAVDLGADRVYVRRADLGGAMMADRDAAGWRRIDDPALEAALEDR